MSFDSVTPFEDEFIAAFCPVCDRSIPVEFEDVTEEFEVITKPGKKLGASKKTTTTTMDYTGALNSRRKSNSNQKGSKGNRSHTSLTSLGLTASTPMVPSPPPITASLALEGIVAFNPPSSLYCSVECKELDEMRSRLAFADLEPTLALKQRDRRGIARQGVLEVSPGRRRSSGVSQTTSDAYSESNGSDYFYNQSFATTTTTTATALNRGGAYPASTSYDLDFSARRSSRGSEGGAYSYKPSWKARSEGGGQSSRSNHRSSTDSLVSMNESGMIEDKPASMNRLPTALSALRYMTPISTPPLSLAPTASTSNPSNSTIRKPPPLVRSTSDEVRSSNKERSGRSNGGRERSRKEVEEGAGGGSGEPRSQSDPGRAMADRLEMPPPPILLKPSPSTSPSTLRPPRRSESSASLALMGSSFLSRSNLMDRSMGTSIGGTGGGGWSGRTPKRSASTISLSGLVAIGNFSSSLVDSTPMARSRSGGDRMGRSNSTMIATTSSTPRRPVSASPDSSSSASINSSTAFAPRRRRPLSSSYSQSSPPTSSSNLSPKLKSHRSGSSSTNIKARQGLIMTRSSDATPTTMTTSSSAISSSSISPDPISPASFLLPRRPSSSSGHFLDHVLADAAGGMRRKSFSNRRKSRAEGEEVARSRSRNGRMNMVSSSASTSKLSDLVSANSDGVRMRREEEEITLNRTRSYLNVTKQPPLRTYSALDLDQVLMTVPNTTTTMMGHDGITPIARVGEKKKKLFYFDEGGD